MNNPNLMVRYVGLKESETDCVAGTGITWTGKGDVQLVPPAAWEIMAKHADVWELVIDDDSARTASTGQTLGDAETKTESAEATSSTAVAPVAAVVETTPVVAKKVVPAKKVAAKTVAAKKVAAKKAPAKPAAKPKTEPADASA